MHLTPPEIHTELGLGALCDRDFAQFLAGCRIAGDTPAKDEVLLALLELSAGRGASFALEWRAQRTSCRYVPDGDLEREFRFHRRPRVDLPGSR